MKLHRTRTVLNGMEVVEVISFDVSWAELRSSRDQELVRTDPWALKDRIMSQEKKDYRQALRELPQNHPSANEAVDNWPVAPDE